MFEEKSEFGNAFALLHGVGDKSKCKMIVDNFSYNEIKLEEFY